MKEETDRQQWHQLEQTSTAYILHVDTLHLNIDEVFSFLNGIHVGMEDGLLRWHTG